MLPFSTSSTVISAYVLTCCNFRISKGMQIFIWSSIDGLHTAQISRRSSHDRHVQSGRRGWETTSSELFTQTLQRFSASTRLVLFSTGAHVSLLAWITCSDVSICLLARVICASNTLCRCGINTVLQQTKTFRLMTSKADKTRQIIKITGKLNIRK